MTPESHLLAVAFDDRVKTLIQDRHWFRYILHPSLRTAFGILFRKFQGKK